MTSRSKTQHKEKEKPPVEVPVIEEKEIIPGKFYEQDWKTLLREDDELDIAVELTSEVTELAWASVRDHLIEEQCFPHACDLATEKMLQIVEWHYLSRDEGEHNTSQDPSWNEDTEPVPAHIDTWARGIVPLTSDNLLVDQNPFDRLLYNSTTDLHPPPTDDNKCTVEEDTVAVTTENTVSEQPATDNVIAMAAVDSKPAPIVAKTRKKMITKTNPMVAVAIDSTSKPPLTSTVSPLKRKSDLDKQVLVSSLKSLKYLPVKPTEVQYDKDGCIVGTVKLDPRKFPSHKIRPNYTVSQAEPIVTRSLRKKPPLASHDPYRASHDPQRIPQTNVTPVISRYPDSMTLPSLVDTIDPVAGVTVLEGGRTRQGPKTIENSELESSYLSSLRPLCRVKPPTDGITSPGNNHTYQLQT